ncbi:MAG TPA: DUF192 domain-containing protein [archaeon]|nr:DUF192 domain-containing protein [archaeon]
MLKNISSGKTIIGKVRLASDSFSRFRGLMLENKENFDYALVFVLAGETKIGASVHMMFVAFPIDIAYLDSQKKVVDTATLQPWILNYTPKAAAKYFVELPIGAAKGISIGNRLEWDK